MKIKPETWDLLIAFTLVFALGVALTILILGE